MRAYANVGYVTGSIGFDPKTMLVVEGGIEAESKQAMKNMNAVSCLVLNCATSIVLMVCLLVMQVLNACGAEKKDVIKCL